MKTDYKITIIMSNYNQARYLERAIQSVLLQKVQVAYRLIITDDCSTEDNSMQLINQYVNKYKNIDAIFSKKNGGYLANILRAKKLVDTEYFCLLDADDYWTDKNWLQRAYDFLEMNRDYSIYEANVLILCDGKTKFFVSPNRRSASYTIEQFVNNKRIVITQTTGMFFRNTIYKYGIPEIVKNAVGTLSEKSFEGDTDRFVMHLDTGKAFYDNRVVGIYRKTADGIWAKLNKSQQLLIQARAYIDYYRYFEKYKTFFVNCSWRLFVQYMIEKQRDMITFQMDESYLEDTENNNIRYIYSFCKKNRHLIMTNESYICKMKRIYHLSKL